MSATATGGHERGIEARRRGPRVPARLLRLASDERLVDVLRGGSEAAFEVIYARHHRGVLSFCRHMLGSVEEAEDAVQHTFMAAYRDLLRSSKPIRLRPWLYAIARNRCLSVLRARRERTSDELVEPSTEHLSSEVERRHDLRALLGDLAALAPDQRAALVLAELGDMSHDEIGDVLGCPKQKVKALVFQARSSLIASRTARETSCAEIREQLANLRGGSLRRNTLRRHLRECEGCREYRDQVLAQRDALALILPVAPTLGLKAAVLGAAGVTAAGGSGSVVATAVVALCVAGGGTAAVDIAREDDGKRPAAREPRPARVVPAAAAPETVAVERSAAPKTRRGTGPADQKAKRRRKPERAAAVAPAVRKDKARGKGANPEAARPLRAEGPEAEGRGPSRRPGPRAEAEGRQGSRAEAEGRQGPRAEAEGGEDPRPEAAEKAARAKPESAAGEPVTDDAAPPPGKSKRG